MSDTETIYVDEDLLPLGINHSQNSHEHISEVSENALDNETNPSPQRNFPRI